MYFCVLENKVILMKFEEEIENIILKINFKKMNIVISAKHECTTQQQKVCLIVSKNLIYYKVTVNNIYRAQTEYL